MTTRLAPQDYLRLLRVDGELLADAARGHLDDAVPTCPGWTVRDVVRHTAEVYEHKLRCIADGRSPGPWPPHWPDGDPIAWYLDGLDRIVAVLSSSGPDAQAYTWWPPEQTIGFWQRRMAQETAVHRVDVQAANGPVTPVDAALATDGVDEVLMIMCTGDWTEEEWDDQAAEELSGRIDVRTGGHIWAVDAGTAWLEVLCDPGTGDERSSDDDQDASNRPAGDVRAAAQATVSGEPSDVLLWLWGRAPIDAVAAEADPAAAQRFRNRLALATQ